MKEKHKKLIVIIITTIVVSIPFVREYWLLTKPVCAQKTSKTYIGRALTIDTLMLQSQIHYQTGAFVDSLDKLIELDLENNKANHLYPKNGLHKWNLKFDINDKFNYFIVTIVPRLNQTRYTTIGATFYDKKNDDYLIAVCQAKEKGSVIVTEPVLKKRLFSSKLFWECNDNKVRSCVRHNMRFDANKMEFKINNSDR